MLKYPNVKIAEYNWISPLPKIAVKPKGDGISNHFLFSTIHYHLTVSVC